MQKKQLLLLLSILISLNYSCDSISQKNGIWESIGYGKILKIDDTQYTFYDITSISCLKADQGSIESVGKSMEASNDTLAVKKGLSIYNYTRVKELPDVCESNHQDPKNLMYNFEVFAETYRDHFAYFDLNNIVLDSLYHVSKNKITSKTTEAELYLVFEEMMGVFNDNHGSIEPSDNVYEEVEKLRTDSPDKESTREYGDFEIAGMVTEHYLDENLTKDSWLIKWGKMEDNIGYIHVNAMMFFAELNLSESLIQKNGFLSTYFEEFEKLNYAEQVELEVQGVRSIMERVMKDLATTQFMILDVRFNGGGNDEVGLEILRHFNAKKQVVASKKAVNVDTYSKEIPIYLSSSDQPYIKPVYVLTSQQSASATDIMALSSLELEHLQRIGSHTNGALSDALQKKLPNGWYFSLSNEIYSDNNGQIYENIGIPVDFNLNYPDDRQTYFRSVANNLEKDKQDVLRAISKLQNDN